MDTATARYRFVYCGHRDREGLCRRLDGRPRRHHPRRHRRGAALEAVDRFHFVRSPAVAADGIIYGTAGRDLVAVKDAGSHGRIEWRYMARGDIEVSASVAPDGTVILGTNDAYEYGISPQGTARWRYPRKVFSYSTPAATPDGLAYFGDNDGYVDVVAAATGTVVGRYDGRGKPLSSVGVGVWTAPLIDSHHDVYFGTAAGHIFGYSYTGTQLFNFATGATVDSYPALTANGTLIIGSDNGNLYAID